MQRISRPDTTEDGELLVILGRVSGPHGVLGWFKVYSDTDPREGITRYRQWYLWRDQRWQLQRVEKGRRQGKHVVAKLHGCDDRDVAEGWRNCDIAVPRAQLPKLNRDGEYYWTDLEGLAVSTLDGVQLGQVDHLFSTGANDVLVVKGDRERLIPYIWEQVVRQVDLEAGTLLVDWDPEF